MSANLFPMLGRENAPADDNLPLLEQSKTKHAQSDAKTVTSKAGDLKNLAGTGDAAAPSVGAEGPVVVHVFKTFKWQGQASPQEVLSHAPLAGPLQRMNLGPNEKFHVKRIFLRSMSTTSKSPIGVRFSAVNGKDLNVEHHDGDHYQWSTLTAHPGTERHFDDQNDGKGLLIHESELSVTDKINSKVSMQNLLKDVQAKPEYVENGVQTHYHVLADFSSMANPETPKNEKMSSMSHAAQLVYLNAKSLINEHPEIKHHLAGVPLKRAKPGQTESFSEVDVRHDNSSAKHPNRFWFVVKADEMDRALAGFKAQLDKAPTGTDAKQHTVSVFRPGQTDPSVNSESTNLIGNIAKEGGVTVADHERSKSVWSAMHLALTYELEHPTQQKVAPAK